ncbi:MAG: amino acid adenylation domain-containing protein, partial [bacterium]|nr:amino acid adenylation domain-containing protein [bacterium]
LPIRYADFAHWQRQWLRGEVLAAQLAYWKQQLAGMREELELPTDRPRPAVPTYRGAFRRLTVPPDLTESLGTLSRREGSTLYMTLLAAFKLLLHSYTRQDDLAVGSPIANRNRSEIEGLIGVFVNTLVLRTGFRAGTTTFQELLAGVREQALGAYAHQDVPFEKLVEELQPERNLTRQPLFQVMFVLQNAPEAGLELAGLEKSPLGISSGTSRFDLTFILAEVGGVLHGLLEYSTDLFDATTVGRFLSHYRVLLGNVAADPGRRLADYSLLGPAERHQTLLEWSDTRADDPQELRIHERFAVQAARTPERIALTCRERQVSYRELEGCSNQLAHTLRELGVGHEVPVGVAVDRSIDLITATLAVFKAGGFLVPLDRTLPEDRLAFILDDAAVGIVLTRRDSHHHLPAHRARTVLLEEERDKIARQPAEAAPSGGAAADNLAYLIYTSGTTGRPKGIAMVHRVLTNLIAWQLRSTPPDGGMRTPQFAPLSFDIIFQETFSALCSGGTLLLLTEDERRDPWQLVALLEAHRIERLYLPFVALQQLCEVTAESPPRGLREVITAGEQLQVNRTVERFFTAAACTLENQYGPSEAHVVSYHPLRGEPGEWPPLPPVGRGIGNFRLYILNSQLHPLPPGVPGEVCLTGPGLARGYLRRPELTAASFLPDPFCDDPARRTAGRRLYRTGDLARFLADGTIEFMGRIDLQVKIRGFRIELGEIETVLGWHPGVRQAVVVVRADAGNRRLAAYVVRADEAAELDAGELRSFLADRLPDYMVPPAVIFLDALPWTPGGKVDRKALPAPEPGTEAADESWVPPRSPLEEMVAGIWSEVLGASGPGVRRIGTHDDFFELGGHSLLASRVVSRLRHQLRVELPMRTLFERPTVAALAERVQELMRAGAEVEAPPINPVARDRGLPLSFAQERLWFLDRYEPDSPLYNLPVLLKIAGALDSAALFGSLRAVVRRHEALRTIFTEGPRQRVVAELALNVPLIDLRALPEAPATASALAVGEARRPFDLATGPLLRAVLLRLGDERHWLLVTLHHIVSDGWSMEVLLREMTVSYQALLAAEPGHATPSPLPPLPVQYPDFACWQRRWLQGAVLGNQLAYWRQQLAGATTTLELPADRPRPPVQSHRGATVARPLPPTLIEPLRRLGQGSTFFMTLLAAFFTLLHRYTGQRQLLVGSPVANREHREIEGLIGFFVNTLVLRGDLARDPSFDGLLDRVRETALGAYAHQDLPFERLVEELQPERDLSRSPFFQVMFFVHRAGRRELAPGLPMDEAGVGSRTAKFDMTLAVIDRGSELASTVTYNTDLFDRTTIRRLLAHFERLLTAIAADPDRRISELPLLARAEEHALLAEWNDTAIREREGNCVHELFARQVARRPDAVAVTQGERVLTYGELGR